MWRSVNVEPISLPNIGKKILIVTKNIDQIYNGKTSQLCYKVLGDNYNRPLGTGNFHTRQYKNVILTFYC